LGKTKGPYMFLVMSIGNFQLLAVVAKPDLDGYKKKKKKIRILRTIGGVYTIFMTNSFPLLIYMKNCFPLLI
jgi:hypothetical protein